MLQILVLHFYVCFKFKYFIDMIMDEKFIIAEAEKKTHGSTLLSAFVTYQITSDLVS